MYKQVTTGWGIKVLGASSHGSLWTWLPHSGGRKDEPNVNARSKINRRSRRDMTGTRNDAGKLDKIISDPHPHPVRPSTSGPTPSPLAPAAGRTGRLVSAEDTRYIWLNTTHMSYCGTGTKSNIWWTPWAKTEMV